MNRLFGTAKQAAPKPTLGDVNGSLEKRGEQQDEKIQKLDKELARYTEQMKKMKPGAARRARVESSAGRTERARMAQRPSTAAPLSAVHHSAAILRHRSPPPCERRRRRRRRRRRVSVWFLLLVGLSSLPRAVACVRACVRARCDGASAAPTPPFAGPAKQQVQKRALAILKQKKMYENQRDQTRNQQFNVDQIAFAQEGLKETASTVAAMKDANKALKKQFKQINISQVDDMQVGTPPQLWSARAQHAWRAVEGRGDGWGVLGWNWDCACMCHPMTVPAYASAALLTWRAQDDMADLLEQAEEVQEALGRSYNTDDIDEADLEAELGAPATTTTAPGKCLKSHDDDCQPPQNPYDDSQTTSKPLRPTAR